MKRNHAKDHEEIVSKTRIEEENENLTKKRTKLKIRDISLSLVLTIVNIF